LRAGDIGVVFGGIALRLCGVFRCTAQRGCGLLDGGYWPFGVFPVFHAERQDRARASAIIPWEIALLVGKGLLDLGKDVLIWIRDALALPGVTLIPLLPEIAVASTRLPFEMLADPADRILVATARHLGALLVTADGALLELAKQGHFVAMDAGT
jgi:PIN domain nuclease of toxin-antitoxin system